MPQIFDFTTFFTRHSDLLEENSALEQALSRLPPIGVDGPWIAGGAVRRTIMRKPLDSDFDFFFRDEEQFDAFVSSIKERGGWITSSNQHNVTLRLPSVAPRSIAEDEFSPYLPEIEIQAICTQFWPSLPAVLDSFDFTICQFGYDGTHLVFGDYALYDLGRKRLVPHKITFATASLRRVIKYTSQGFSVCSGSLSNLLDQVVANPSIIAAETGYID